MEIKIKKTKKLIAINHIYPYNIIAIRWRLISTWRVARLFYGFLVNDKFTFG